MKNIKSLFDTPIKALISVTCIVVLLFFLGSGVAFVVKAISGSHSIEEENAKFKKEMAQKENPKDTGFQNEGTQNRDKEPSLPDSVEQIGLDTAKNTALSDAALLSSDVTYTKEQLDYEDGFAVYDIEFYTSTHKYEYEIDAATGTIRSKDIETYKIAGEPSGNKESSETSIDLENAKSIAANHAGFAVEDVSFSKTKLEREDGQTVYEVEFYKDGKEYEYTINASDGSIMEYDVD